MHSSSLLRKLSLAAVLTLCLGSCKHIDSNRLPVSYVNLVFYTQADWVTHGVSGAGQWKQFILEKHIPSNFFYTASSYTGLGGILLCTTYAGEIAAYDLACPVECRADVRVAINDDNYAECPRCHSQYDVFSLAGGPISGTAAQEGYGLQRYSAGSGPSGEYMVIH
jgi:hypothetical protein